MREMYKDNAGNWHYGYKGEKLSEVSYSTNSVPNSIPIEWISKYSRKPISNADYWAIMRMVTEWEKENEID